MGDLVEWLRAQLDEDERIARAASEYTEAEWRLDEDGETVLWWPPEPRVADKEREKGLPVVSDRWRGQTIYARAAPHVAAHDPARVLREIDAKRRILAEHWLNGWVCDTCDNGEVGQTFPCATLRLLALPYADRPGYREEWRP
ncbi:DUF6221 family protein [Streptomyces sp. NPDC059597]|uniref:DUF6221 family protein n=1 Tax=Streptomyces sp. NPDC059597 TaxID=3346879 RepID=UPI00368EB365